MLVMGSVLLRYIHGEVSSEEVCYSVLREVMSVARRCHVVLSARYVDISVVTVKAQHRVGLSVAVVVDDPSFYQKVFDTLCSQVENLSFEGNTVVDVVVNTLRSQVVV